MAHTIASVSVALAAETVGVEPKLNSIAAPDADAATPVVEHPELMGFLTPLSQS
jgi:hypothetical protein